MLSFIKIAATLYKNLYNYYNSCGYLPRALHVTKKMRFLLRDSPVDEKFKNRLRKKLKVTFLRM